ncbi:GL17708 [Drosophila persimilis]|uniref:Oxysterol-binding protein n=1 Tax=Drosophila persimilis TaxID=7234 RepID=B4GIG0_DROPE|nr:GL17708 [Drosophila persimilis]
MASTPSSAPSSGAGFGAGAGAGAGASTLEGTLSKWTNVMKGWQYRFFVLDENAGLLSYYTSKEKMMKGVRRGCVRLKDALIGIDDQEDNTFTITVDHKTFHFQARHSEEREQWVRRLEDTIRRHANRSRLWDSQSAFYIAGGYTKESSYGGKRPNHLELLARRAMLDHIKHSIVSLQIAKNMAHPINGIYNGPQAAASTTSSASGGVIIGGGIGMSKDMLAGKGEPGDDEDDSITENDEVQDTNEVHDGPVPWCRRDQLTFLAEQVSHHPPISAFYAEHYNKKITFAAHVWTKSKFLGLSIGVHNIGEGVVTLVDRSEEYIVTFPNGYGRQVSILTVPWIELGGSVEIKCPQTGYHANVEFLTKPFYGGKRNKVSAEVYAPNDKKPFVSIAGEWSGLMEAKWHDKNKTEVFVDVNRIPIFKKQVRPIVEQDEYESRRVWKEVTAGLKFNDIERATNAKFVVEQQQRDQVKMRKEYDLAWEHKHFKPVGENWIYAKSLSQRIYLQEKEARR